MWRKWLWIWLLAVVVGAAHAGETERGFLDRIRARLLRTPSAVTHVTSAVTHVTKVPTAARRVLRLTLGECIRRTEQHNKKVRAGDYAIGAAKAQQEEADARFWPIFEYEYRTAPVPNDASDALSAFVKGNITWFHSARVGMAIPLTGFGKLTLLQQLARQGAHAAVQEQEKERVGAVAKTRQLYYGVQLGEEISGLLRDAIGRITDELTAAEREAEQAFSTPPAPADGVNHPPDGVSERTGTPDPGDALDAAAAPVPARTAPRLSPIDKLRLQYFRAELEKRLAEALQRRDLAIEGLRIQIGLESGERIGLAHRQLRVARGQLGSLESYVAEALAHRPDAQLVEIGVEAKRLSYALERRKPLPEVGVGGFFEAGRTIADVSGLTSTDNFTNPFHYTRAGFGLQLKGRFDPHGDFARMRKKQHEYYKASLERMLARDGIGLEVREAYGEARRWREQITRGKEVVEVAQRWVFLTKSNMDLGVGEKNEYTDALQAMLQAKGQYFESVFQYNSALAKLDEKIGAVPYTGQRGQDE
ncbi:MAG: TolC family protein [Deltaproteobacteria bacterium]|nr:TolC family protein [Deltaproteobacteria bacterium]